MGRLRRRVPGTDSALPTGQTTRVRIQSARPLRDLRRLGDLTRRLARVDSRALDVLTFSLGCGFGFVMGNRVGLS